MKFVIRERKSLKESSSAPTRTFRVKISPETFLALTPSDARADIGIRAISIGSFSQKEAGDMFLAIDPKSGQVLQHSGRARSQAAINSKVPEIEINIRIPENYPAATWEQMPSTFRQQEGSNAVSKDKFTPVETPDGSGSEDPLGLGGSSKTFRDEIMPAMTLPNGYQRPEMKTKDAEAIAKAFMKAALAKYGDSVKKKLGAVDLDDAIKKSGLGSNGYVEKNAQDFQKILDSKYSIADEQGELTFSFMDERYRGKFWGRQPVGNITISKI